MLKPALGAGGGAGAASQPHPAVSACRLLQAASERPLWDASVKAPGCLEALRDPQAQGLFQHLLRAKASGTVER